ncbi:hypothetical protein D3C85_1830980 [compost metagenome]
MKGVADGRAFTQELGSGDNIEGMVRVGSDELADFLIRANRNSRLGHDDFVAFHRLGNLRSGSFDIP